MAQVTAEQVERLRRFANEEAARTRRGRHWLQLLRSHQQELLHRYAASPALQALIDQALGQAAALVESLDTDRPQVVDAAAVATVEAVLTELDTPVFIHPWSRPGRSPCGLRPGHDGRWVV